MPPAPAPKHARPKPLLRLVNNALEDPGCVVFSSVFASPKDALHLAIHHVLTHLYPSTYSTSPDAVPDGPDRPWQEVRSITLIVGPNGGGVAATSGLQIDAAHKEISFASEYALHMAKSPRLHDELVGVLVHEMVHCFQHDARGSAPGGLIEGMADYVRLRAGYSPPHWQKERRARWDEGYQHTGYFLDWLEAEFGRGSVERINMALKGTEYDEKTLWKSLFGRHVDDLFDDYTKTLPPLHHAKDDTKDGDGAGRGGGDDKSDAWERASPYDCSRALHTLIQSDSHKHLLQTVSVPAPIQLTRNAG